MKYGCWRGKLLETSKRIFFIKIGILRLERCDWHWRKKTLSEEKKDAYVVYEIIFPYRWETGVKPKNCRVGEGETRCTVTNKGVESLTTREAESPGRTGVIRGTRVDKETSTVERIHYNHGRVRDDRPNRTVWTVDFPRITRSTNKKGCCNKNREWDSVVSLGPTRVHSKLGGHETKKHSGHWPYFLKYKILSQRSRTVITVKPDLLRYNTPTGNVSSNKSSWGSETGEVRSSWGWGFDTGTFYRGLERHRGTCLNKDQLLATICACVSGRVLWVSASGHETLKDGHTLTEP